ncbi:MAG: luciferase family protein [Phenylobacterium sp.]|nr:luciferase family protein [Phenylobacterium sp.]
MRLDVVLPNEGPFAVEALRAAAQFEAMGYEGLWLTDHVIGIEGYRPVYGDFWLEILTSLSFVAASTKTIRLGTGVLVLPLRDAVLTAKMLATIDVLSNGRLDLGIGTGWARREFSALGRGEAFEPRGAVTDEALDVFLECWKGGEHSFERRFSQVSKIRFEPTPVQKPHPPIWVGGRGLAPAPLRRAAKYADIWHPTGITPDEIREGGEKLDALAGRKIDRSIRLQAGADLRDQLRRYRDAGCIQAAIDFKAGSLAELLKLAEAVAKEPV